MKVSVVISTYNRPEKLKRAIKSVLNQTFKDYELIVVHDGKPTDEETFKLIRLQFPTTNFYSLDKNSGSDTKPKNEGILESKGEYIAFLDDDNEWRPDHLQVLVKALEENPDITLAYGDRWLYDEDNNKDLGLGISADFDPTLLLARNYIDTSDVLVRREALFDVGGWDETCKKYVDWNLWVRLVKAGYDFLRVPLIITNYYTSQNTKSIKVLTKNEENFFKNTGKFKNIPDWDGKDCDIQLPYLGAIKEPRIAIFSLTYDRLEYTKKCFDSLYKTAGHAFDHYVVDNGSTDGTVTWLKSKFEDKPAKEVILNDTNKGISIASNQALNAIKKSYRGPYDIIVKVDNDCLFLNQDWLKTMVDIWKCNRRLVMSCYVQGLKDNPGGAPREERGYIKGVYVGMTLHIGGICSFADASAYKTFRWDEDSFLHGMQDVEFSQYLNKAGYQTCYLENFFCEHIEGTDGQHKKYPEYFERRKYEKTHKA